MINSYADLDVENCHAPDLHATQKDRLNFKHPSVIMGCDKLFIFFVKFTNSSTLFKVLVQ